jgi:hypothetical protein
MCPAQFHSPLFLIVIFARIYKTVTCDTICTADEGVLKGENIYTKILRKLWLVCGIYVFKNSVLVFMMFICKLANQRRQRLPIHRYYSHAGTQVSKKILLCSLDEDRHYIFGKTNVTGQIFKIVCHQCRLSFHLELIRNRVVSREV